MGPVPMIEGSTPQVAQDTIRPSGFTPRAWASSADISTTAAAPSLMPLALPAVTVPSLSKAGRSLARDLGGDAVAGILVGFSTTMSPLRVLMVTGTISSLKRAGLLGRLGLVLGGRGEGVLLLAGDLPLLGDVLGGVAHVVAVEGVPQAVLDHGVDELHGRPSWCRCAGAPQWGAWLMLSWPPATTMPESPTFIAW